MPKKQYIVISTKTTPTKSDLSLPPTQIEYHFRVEITPKPLVFGQTISSVTKSDLTTPDKTIVLSSNSVTPEKKPFGDPVEKETQMEINQVLKDIQKN